MISFKRPEDVVPSCLILLSILILAGTLAYMLLVPKPSAAGSTALSARSRRRLVSDIAVTKKQGREAEAAVRPRLWHSDPQSVTATALAQMTDLAGKHNVKMTAFRPARSQAFESMTELRFEAQLSGPYAGIHAVMAALDARGSKIVLRGAQIASSQEAGNGVAATLGLSAFVASDPDLTPGEKLSERPPRPNSGEPRKSKEAADTFPGFLSGSPELGRGGFPETASRKGAAHG